MLKGKNAVVTGAARGIGKQIAIKLAENGANVAVNYRTLNEDVENLIKEIEAKGVKAIGVQGDISIAKEAEHIINEAKKELGSVDILVNNAGITKDGLVMRMKEEDFDKVLEVNLKGTFNTTKAVSSIMMKQRKGKIVNLSSVVGITGNAGQCNYAASKAGVIGFSKSIARELAGRGINVNVVAPGFIQTDMTDVLPEKVKETVLSSIPMKKLGNAEDVANLVVFLSSDQSNYITGQVINVDGGMVMA